MRARSTRGSESCAARVVTVSCALSGLDVCTMPRTTTGPVAAATRSARPVAGGRDPTPVDEHRGAVGEHQRGQHVVAVLAVVHLVAQQHLVRGVVATRRLGPAAGAAPPTATSGAGAAYAARASRTSDCL